MNIKSCTITNILSIKDISISFDDTGLTLIEGWNTDADSANGAGKSAVFHSICWGLYGKMPRDITANQMTYAGDKISNSLRKMSCEVTVCKDNSSFTIFRSRNPNTLSLNKEDITQEALPLSLTYEQFLLFAYFAQGLGKRFLDLDDRQRKELFLSMAGIDKFASAKELVDSDIKKTISILNDIDTKISRLEGKKDTLNSIIDISDKQQILLEHIDLLNQKKVELNELKQRAPDTPDISKHEETIDKLQRKLDDINEAKGAISTLKKQLDKIKALKEPIDTYDGCCPQCNALLDIVEGELCIHDTSSFDRKKQLFYIEQKEKILEINESIDSYKLSISKEEAIKTTIASIRKNIEKARSEYEQFMQLVNIKKIDITNEDKIIKQIEFEIAKINQMKNDLKLVISELDKVKKEKEDIELRLTVLKATSSSLGPSGLPAYIVDDVIETFNENVQNILNTSWPQLQYYLTAYKENSDGSVVAKFNHNISLNGRITGVGSLSGGEFRCLSTVLDIASTLTFERMTGNKIKTIVLDEPFDGMDFANRNKALDILRELSTDRHIIVIDHLSELKAQFDKVITIEKSNGFSIIRGNNGKDN